MGKEKKETEDDDNAASDAETAMDVDEENIDDSEAPKNNKLLVQKMKNGVVICTVCDVACKAKATNWYEKKTDSRGNPIPEGCLCKSCGEFAESSPWEPEQLVRMAQDKKKARYFGGQRAA